MDNDSLTNPKEAIKELTEIFVEYRGLLLVELSKRNTEMYTSAKELFED